MNLWKKLLNLIRKNPRSRHYQRWTFTEYWEINADDRPSDEVLSRRLGRTVRAIKEKRREQ